VIVVASLSTSRDVIVQAPSWAAGAVERADREEIGPGGKAFNVARICGRMGTPVRLVAVVDAVLSEDVRPALSPLVETHVVISATLSRTDICLTDGAGTTTVINAPVPEPESIDVTRAMSLLEDRVEAGDIVVVAGRQPEGACRRLLELTEQRSARALLDTSGPDLAASLSRAPSVVKVNASELAAISRGSDPADAWRDGRALAPLAKELVVTGGVMGARAWLADGRLVEVRPPRIRAVNAFGAGDALTAGIVAALVEDRPLLEGLIRGTAWAAASAEQLTLDFDPERAQALEAQVAIDDAAEGSAREERTHQASRPAHEGIDG
jgi:fructose-1-phosphate kinase PfkB-like protein